MLSGGELGAAVILDTVTRLIPGALGNEASTRQESFTADSQRWRPAAPIQLARRADCWIIRITRGRRTFADGRCRRFWFRAITKKYAAGAGARLWRRRCATVPICWTGPRSSDEDRRITGPDRGQASLNKFQRFLLLGDKIMTQPDHRKTSGQDQAHRHSRIRPGRHGPRARKDQGRRQGTPAGF